ncbi:MAG: HD domain-containing protein [Desulfobulbaceae bacterium]|nr:MAG: HD domain-containing protein [Desulfobulbaceae bacterium]
MWSLPVLSLHEGDKMAWVNRKYSFYISITTVLISNVLLLAGMFLWITHKESRSAAFETADALFSEINTKTIERYESAFHSVSLVTSMAAPLPGFQNPPIDEEVSHPSLNYMFEALVHHDYIYSTYIGYADGSFVQIIAMRGKTELQQAFKAPKHTAFVLRIIAPSVNGVMKHSWHYIDENRQIIGELDNLDSIYDPRSRIWYQQALKQDSTFFTKTYVFSSYKIPGITCAKKIGSGNGVIGIDLTLEQFSQSLEDQQISENGLLFLFNHSGQLIALPHEETVIVDEKGELTFLHGSQSHNPTVGAVIADFMQKGETILGMTREITINGERYLVMLTEVSEQLNFNQILASIAPVSDFTALIRLMQERILILCCLVLVFVLPLALFFSKILARSLSQLESEAQKIGQRDFSESPPFDSNIKELHTLINAFTLMKRTIRQLLERQRKLFDDFTKLTAGAIDAKSPYTGKHCSRVPVVAQMLAKAACNTKEGPLADFDMPTEDEKWEFEIAAWLHDCGKVTTPEYIVDKATKLETIYNRLHEIRMRFEVLLRDAEIAHYQQLLKGKEIDQSQKAALEKQKREIIADFEFIAACNIGAESMTDEDIERIKVISARTWMRNLDDRIGISAEESSRKTAHPAPTLPVEENIIADQPWHSKPWQTKGKQLSEFKDFNMEIPDEQYNLGELYNLCIRTGTLSPEDRYKIQEHIIQTINMLSKLDFPDYLAKVPEFAGAHHETMIGTGYPQGLKKEDMSIPARIIAIADIYEALTAADRPYKTPKKLSSTLKIMSSMCKDQHIDKDLFNLFLRSGVYQLYAEKYLTKEQIDDIVIDDYLVSS